MVNEQIDSFCNDDLTTSGLEHLDFVEFAKI